MISIGNQTSDTAYLSSISHRAFGGIKQMVINTENETTVSIGYDSALRPATYVADNDAVDGDIQNAAYTYGKDGLVSSVDNAAAPEFDQSNAYDFAGRLKASTAGPLEQWLEYDPFSNLTQRQNEFYEYVDRFVAVYANNRKAYSLVGDGYDYHDNAGNVVNTHFQPHVGLGNRPVVDDKKWVFDAAGRMTYFTQFTTAPPQTSDAKEVKQETTFDGDGRPVKEDNKWRDCETAEKVEDCTGEWLGEPFYYLISSVTGQRITHVQTGLNAGQAIYLGGTKIAGYWAYDESRRFTLTDPVTGSTAPMESDGTVYESTRTELGALGTSVPLTEPPAFPPVLDFETGYPGDSEYGCTDPEGNPEPCSIGRVRDHIGNIARAKAKRLQKEALSIVLPRQKAQMPWQSPGRGPSAGLAAEPAFGDAPEPDTEDPCPWDKDGTKDCAATVNAPIETVDGFVDASEALPSSTPPPSIGLGRGPHNPEQSARDILSNRLKDMNDACVQALKNVGLYDAVAKATPSAKIISVTDHGSEPARRYIPAQVTNGGESLATFFAREVVGKGSKAYSSQLGIVSMDGGETFVPGGGLGGPPRQDGLFMHEMVHHATGATDPELVLRFSLSKNQGESDSKTLDRFFNNDCPTTMILKASP